MTKIDLFNKEKVDSRRLQQVTKLGVTAPKSVEIPIEETEDFALSEVTVLKLEPGKSSVVNTACSFDNGDALNFRENPMVQFDGTMRLITSLYLDTTRHNHIDEGFLTVTRVDRSAMERMLVMEVV